MLPSIFSPRSPPQMMGAEEDEDPYADQENIPPPSETAGFGSQLHHPDSDCDSEPLPLPDYPADPEEDDEEGAMAEGLYRNGSAPPLAEAYDYEGGGGGDEEYGEYPAADGEEDPEAAAAAYDSFSEDEGEGAEEGAAGPSVRVKRPKHWRLREDIMRRQSLAGNAFGLGVSPSRGLRRSTRHRQPAMDWWRMQRLEAVQSLEYSRHYRSLPTRKIVPEAPEVRVTHTVVGRL